LSDTVLYEVADGVALLTLNRPDRMNAIVPEMGERLFDLLELAGRDPEVRAIVVTGAGRAFCAGQDMEVLGELGSGEQQLDAVVAARPQTLPLTIPKPIIAAINGACAGLGLVAATMYDLRFAAAGAKLTTAFARRGLVAEYGISWIVPRIVGLSAAMDLLISGRVVLAEEAHRLGLVDRVVAPEQLMPETLAYARELATCCSPASMATIKRQIHRDLSSDLESAVQRADELVRHSFTRPDIAEGVASFTERRAPRFPPLDA
jgi:enoyl-CoA hydratase/carnithine racemase